MIRYGIRIGFALGVGQVFPCTEQGIRDAITEGGGPFTFDCDGPKTVVTEDQIVIDNDVVLNGEGELTVEGSAGSNVLYVADGVTAELQAFAVVGGDAGISNGGSLVLTTSTVSGNGIGIWTIPGSSSTVTSSTVVGNSTGIATQGDLTVVNSTATSSGNRGLPSIAIFQDVQATVTSSTVRARGSVRESLAIDVGLGTGRGNANLTLTNTLVDANPPFATSVRLRCDRGLGTCEPRARSRRTITYALLNPSGFKLISPALILLDQRFPRTSIDLDLRYDPRSKGHAPGRSRVLVSRTRWPP